MARLILFPLCSEWVLFPVSVIDGCLFVMVSVNVAVEVCHHLQPRQRGGERVMLRRVGDSVSLCFSHAVGTWCLSDFAYVSIMRASKPFSQHQIFKTSFRLIVGEVLLWAHPLNLGRPSLKALHVVNVLLLLCPAGT